MFFILTQLIGNMSGLTRKKLLVQYIHMWNKENRWIIFIFGLLLHMVSWYCLFHIYLWPFAAHDLVILSLSYLSVRKTISCGSCVLFGVHCTLTHSHCCDIADLVFRNNTDFALNINRQSSPLFLLFPGFDKPPWRIFRSTALLLWELTKLPNEAYIQHTSI